MPELCTPQIQAVAMRVCDLDPISGIPLPGSDTMIVSDALTELTYDTVYEDGTNLFERNAGGDACLDYRDDDVKRRLQVSITVCTHDPNLTAKLSGGDVLTIDAGNDEIGWAAAPSGKLERRLISVEVWAKRITDGDLDPDFPYAWWVFPKIANLREGAGKFANESKKPVYTGQAYENQNWFDGPLNDWPSTSDRTHQWVPTTLLPTIECGPQPIPVS